MNQFVLVNIPSSKNAYHSFRDFAASFPPIGLASIAAVLEKQGYRVTIIDGDAENMGLNETVARVVDSDSGYVEATTMTATMKLLRKPKERTSRHHVHCWGYSYTDTTGVHGN